MTEFVIADLLLLILLAIGACGRTAPARLASVRAATPERTARA